MLTKRLLRVTLQSGRVLLATSAKSFVTIQGDELVPTEGSKLKVGDLVPIAINNPHTIKTSIDLRKHLSPDSFTYASNVQKMLDAGAMNSAALFKSMKDDGCVLPMTHETFYNKFNVETARGRKTLAKLAADAVYTNNISLTEYEIPEIMMLDFDFGWLCGIYVAEGSMCGQLSTFQIAASHLDLQQNIIRIVNQWKIKCKVYGPQQGTSVHCCCRVLSALLLALFNKGAKDKRIHPDLFAAPTSWIAGFLSGYIDGDGCVSGNRIICASASQGLLRDVQHLATRFGITATFGQQGPKQTTMKDGSVIRTSTTHRLVWGVRAATRLRDVLSLVREHKKLALINITDHNAHLAGEVVVLNDVIADKIKEIEVIAWQEKVYDLTVDGFKTFNGLDGWVIYDTYSIPSSNSITLCILNLNDAASTCRAPATRLSARVFPAYKAWSISQNKRSRIPVLRCC